MKNSEFIELLNLYLDHEISPADAARLEAEVQANAARRHTYKQYCRMQKACTVLAQDFQKQAAEAAPSDGKVIAFEAAPPQRGRGAAIYAGIGLAAACVTFIVVSRQPAKVNAPASPTLAATTAAASVDAKLLASSGDAAAPRPFSARTVTVGLHRTDTTTPVLATKAFALSATDATLASTAASEQLDWLNGVQFEPVPSVRPEDLLSEVKRLRQNDARALDPRTMARGQAEMSAFKYQK